MVMYLNSACAENQALKKLWNGESIGRIKIVGGKPGEQAIGITTHSGALFVELFDHFFLKIRNSMIKELAKLLGGDWAVTRPLVEKGWTTNDRQIGLSGRTVRPRLIITCGVSGAIQFTACMNGSDHIVSINTDKDAPIFEVAHIGIVGDLYEIVPALINQLKEAQA
jgi:hypothetical protein